MCPRCERDLAFYGVAEDWLFYCPSCGAVETFTNEELMAAL